MAFLDDFNIDYVTKRIYHNTGTTVYTANQMYSALQDEFDELVQMDDPVPMTAQTPVEYTIVNGWYMDETSFEYIYGGAIKTDGWDHATYPTDGIRKITFTTWVNPLTGTDIGKPLVGQSTSDTGTIVDYDNTNEIIWVRVTTAADNFDTPEQVLITGGTALGANLTIAATTGENLWANIYSLGSLANVDFTLDGAHSGGNTITVKEVVDVHIPQSTYIYVDDGGGGFDQYTVTSWTGKVFTVTETVGSYSDDDAAYWAPQIYVFQDTAVLTSWWPTDHLDVLVKVKDMGTEIDNADITVFCRSYSDLYDHFPIDLSAGGRQAVPLATADDLNNQTLAATVTTYAHTNIGGSDGATGVDISFGSYSEDIEDGNGNQTYNITVDCGGRRLSQVYEVVKWVTRESSTQDLNGDQGQVYISYNTAWSPVKASPFGTFAGGTYFGARGVWLANLHSDDIQAFQLIDSNGVTRNPPNKQNVSVSGLVSGDRVSVFRTTGDNFIIDKTLYTSHNTNNVADSTSFEVTTSITADTPSAGYLRVFASDGTEQRFQYASWTGSIFTLTELHGGGFDNTYTAYPPAIDTEAGVGAYGSTWSVGEAKLFVSLTYVSDRTMMARVRKKGIIPFQTKGTFNATSGYAATAIRTTDTIVT